MKIRILFFPKVPWNECEQCFIGPAVLNEGSHIRLGFGLFFIEIGILIRREAEDESNS
jgi:hypothetical protein